MASEKSLKAKKNIVDEISSKIKDSESIIIFSYQGMTVADVTKLRNELRKTDSEMKIYKNTLARRAFSETGLNDEKFWEGPNAIIFGKSLLEPIKIISKFQKDNEHVVIRSGLADGKVMDTNTINEYASIPSKEGLLNMFAAGIMEHARNFAICVDLYAKKLEEEK